MIQFQISKRELIRKNCKSSIYEYRPPEDSVVDIRHGWVHRRLRFTFIFVSGRRFIPARKGFNLLEAKVESLRAVSPKMSDFYFRAPDTGGDKPRRYFLT